MELKDFFEKYKKVCVAFSGGVDSAYLLFTAAKYAEDVTAYYAKTQFQPAFELNDAKRLAEEIGIKLKIIELDVLLDEDIKNNPANRCYCCKKKLFSKIYNEAKKDGYDIILDGTNASDDETERPGTKALKELSVLSPLRECGLTKEKIRSLSKQAGLFTWNKPAYACLATRIPCGEVITENKLIRTERAEDFLFSLGFSDFRVRSVDETAKIQIKEEQFLLMLQNKNKICNELKKYYNGVLLDLEGR